MTRQYWANMALCIVLGVLVIFAITRVGSALTSKGLFASEPKPSHEAENMMQKLLLQDFQMVKDPSNMVKAEFLVQNNGDKNIKNVRILCEFFDKEGEGAKYLDQETWLLAETIPAMHSLKISTVSKRFIHTGARAWKCRINDLQLVKKPAFSLDKHVGASHGKSIEAGHGEPAAAGH